jgi:transposase
MEACATAHYWARELTALGHEVRLMPPAYVKPYVKGSVALTCQTTGYGSCSDRQTHYRLCLTKLMQQSQEPRPRRTMTVNRHRSLDPSRGKRNAWV